MNTKLIINIVIIVSILFLIWWVANRGKSKGKIFLGYSFFRHQDSPDGDLQYLPALSGNVKALKQACNDNDACIAFNTAGYLKKSIDPNNLKEYSGYPDWAGLYVKRKAIN